MSENNSTAAPIVTDLSTVDAMTQAAVLIVNGAADKYRQVLTNIAAGSETVEEIAARLAETSTDDKIVALREKIADAQEKLVGMVRAEAEALKASAPVVSDDEQKKARTAYRDALSVFERQESADSVRHFLNLVEEKGSRTSAGLRAATSGPTKAAPRGLSFTVNGENVGTASAAGKALGLPTADVLNLYGQALGFGEMTHENIAANPQKDWARSTEFKVGDNTVKVDFDPTKIKN